MGNGFLQGHVYLAVKPAPELLALANPRDPVANAPYRLQDASLYKGRYYAYFGPIPALTLFAPYKALSGFDFPTNFGVALYCCAGFGFSCALLLLVEQRFLKIIPPLWLNALFALPMPTNLSCSRGL